MVQQQHLNQSLTSLVLRLYQVVKVLRCMVKKIGVNEQILIPCLRWWWKIFSASYYHLYDIYQQQVQAITPLVEENLYIRNKNLQSVAFNLTCMHHFIDMIYYFGIVRLPSKEYYWSGKKCMPWHYIVNELGMTKEKIILLWRNFYVQDVNEFDNYDE